ncbi:hypothetical protein HDC92_002238 [Pedobacter sp. AK017]|uniref:Crp/Fnr family transcriptional regulator n=1 Tax=Pedobacter sp. AK017 TaxID=2723073 RepID=UPI0016142AA0|nr:Crp/Fnr family transcriptional regulator [Pedobacter sp. AK017]MBB5438562.1 hypothetical protein [Pedobacter sp. AK017]
MSKKNKLIKKEIISDNSYNELFSYLNIHTIHDQEFQPTLKKMLVGYYTNGTAKISSINSIHTKCWFINSGMIVGVLRNNKGKIVVVIFKAGEIAILPDSFFNGEFPNCYFIAIPDTHLLEISADNIKVVFEMFPEANTLSNLIIASNTKNFMEKGELLQLPAKERIMELHKRYPDIQGRNRKIKLLDKCQASYIGVTESTFSKLLKEIYGEEH